MYPYKGEIAAGIVRGESYPVKKDNQGNWVEDTSRRLTKNPQHHVFYDAWVTARYNDHVRGRIPFPAVESIWLNHAKGHDAGRQWFANTPLGRVPRSIAEWQTISIKQMNEVSEVIGNAMGLDPKTISKLQTQATKYLRNKTRRRGC